MLTMRQTAQWIVVALFVVWTSFGNWYSWRSLLPSPNQQTVDRSDRGTKNSSPKITTPKSADDRIADYTWWVAAFTFALSVVSGFQIFFLIRTDKTARLAADAARKSAEHIPRAERAYIFGGIKFWDPVDRNKDGIRCVKINISMANYGKTPGFIRHIETGWCPIDEAVKGDPFYTDCFAISDLYFPTMKMDEVRETRASVTVPADGNYVMFQRVFYDDIFGSPHFSGSAYRFFRDPNGPDDMSILNEPFVGNPAFWAWDKEKDG
jgi:hypothetical protein